MRAEFSMSHIFCLETHSLIVSDVHGIFGEKIRKRRPGRSWSLRDLFLALVGFLPVDQATSANIQNQMWKRDQAQLVPGWMVALQSMWNKHWRCLGHTKKRFLTIALICFRVWWCLVSDTPVTKQVQESNWLKVPSLHGPCILLELISRDPTFFWFEAHFLFSRALHISRRPIKGVCVWERQEREIIFDVIKIILAAIVSTERYPPMCFPLWFERILHPQHPDVIRVFHSPLFFATEFWKLFCYEPVSKGSFVYHHQHAVHNVNTELMVPVTGWNSQDRGIGPVVDEGPQAVGLLLQGFADGMAVGLNLAIDSPEVSHFTPEVFWLFCYLVPQRLVEVVKHGIFRRLQREQFKEHLSVTERRYEYFLSLTWKTVSPIPLQDHLHPLVITCWFEAAKILPSVSDVAQTSPHQDANCIVQLSTSGAEYLENPSKTSFSSEPKIHWNTQWWAQIEITCSENYWGKLKFSQSRSQWFVVLSRSRLPSPDNCLSRLQSAICRGTDGQTFAFRLIWGTFQRDVLSSCFLCACGKGERRNLYRAQCGQLSLPKSTDLCRHMNSLVVEIRHESVKRMSEGRDEDCARGQRGLQELVVELDALHDLKWGPPLSNNAEIRDKILCLVASSILKKLTMLKRSSAARSKPSKVWSAWSPSVYVSTVRFCLNATLESKHNWFLFSKRKLSRYCPPRGIISSKKGKRSSFLSTRCNHCSSSLAPVKDDPLQQVCLKNTCTWCWWWCSSQSCACWWSRRCAPCCRNGCFSEEGWHQCGTHPSVSQTETIRDSPWDERWCTVQPKSTGQPRSRKSCYWRAREKSAIIKVVKSSASLTGWMAWCWYRSIPLWSHILDLRWIAKACFVICLSSLWL